MPSISLHKSLEQTHFSGLFITLQYGILQYSECYIFFILITIRTVNTTLKALSINGISRLTIEPCKISFLQFYNFVHDAIWSELKQNNSHSAEYLQFIKLHTFLVVAKQYYSLAYLCQLLIQLDNLTCWTSTNNAPPLPN